MSNFNIFGVYVANSLPPGKHSILIQDLAPTFDSIVSTVSGVFDSFSRSHLHIHPPKGEDLWAKSRRERQDRGWSVEMGRN